MILNCAIRDGVIPRGKGVRAEGVAITRAASNFYLGVSVAPRASMPVAGRGITVGGFKVVKVNSVLQRLSQEEFLTWAAK